MALGTCRARVSVGAMMDVYENRASDIWTTKSLGWTHGVAGLGVLTADGKYDGKNLERILQEKSQVNPKNLGVFPWSPAVTQK